MGSLGAISSTSVKEKTSVKKKTAMTTAIITTTTTTTRTAMTTTTTTTSTKDTLAELKGVVKVMIFDEWIATQKDRFLSLEKLAQNHKLATSNEAQRSSSILRMMDIIQLQQFDGVFLPHSLLKQLSKKDPLVKVLSNENGGNDNEILCSLLSVQCILATLLAIWYLSSIFKDQEDQWKLIVLKAKKWLGGNAIQLGVPLKSTFDFVSSFIDAANAHILS